MSMKKWLNGLVVLLAMFMLATTSGSLSVFAETGLAKQPLTANTMEVQLNDDYFNPKVITIPTGKMTTLILKNVGSKEHT
ncbi:cytochrome B, partial [Pseudomonas sp. GP01-A3]